MGYGTQRAIVKLMNEVEGAVPGVRIGGDDSWKPCLVFPMPAGYGGWVDYVAGDYIAFISRRTAPEQVWHKKVGDRRTDMLVVCGRIFAFYREVLAVDTPQPSTRPAPTAPTQTSRPPNYPAATMPPVPSPPPPAPAMRPFTPEIHSPFGGASFVLDAVNYPAVPILALFEEMVTFLSSMVDSGSDPRVIQTDSGPLLTLNTHSHEQIVFFGSHNTIYYSVLHWNDQDEESVQRGPFLIPYEFVHDSAAGALIVGAVFIDALEASRDDATLPLSVRAALEEEANEARAFGDRMLKVMSEEVGNGQATPLRLRGNRTVEALSREYYLGRS